MAVQYIGYLDAISGSRLPAKSSIDDDITTFCPNRPLKWAIGRGREDSDFACDAFYSIVVISGGACRSGVGYPIITSIPRALVVVRTCRSALNMLNVCV